MCWWTAITCSSFIKGETLYNSILYTTLLNQQITLKYLLLYFLELNYACTWGNQKLLPPMLGSKFLTCRCGVRFIDSFLFFTNSFSAVGLRITQTQLSMAELHLLWSVCHFEEERNAQSNTRFTHDIHYAKRLIKSSCRLPLLFSYCNSFFKINSSFFKLLRSSQSFTWLIVCLISVAVLSILNRTHL